MEEFHHSGVVVQRVSGVDADGSAETNGFMVSNAVAHVVDVVQFEEDTRVVYLLLASGPWLVGEDAKQAAGLGQHLPSCSNARYSSLLIAVPLSLLTGRKSWLSARTYRRKDWMEF